MATSLELSGLFISQLKVVPINESTGISRHDSRDHDSLSGQDPALLPVLTSHPPLAQNVFHPVIGDGSGFTRVLISSTASTPDSNPYLDAVTITKYSWVASLALLTYDHGENYSQSVHDALTCR